MDSICDYWVKKHHTIIYVFFRNNSVCVPAETPDLFSLEANCQWDPGIQTTTGQAVSLAFGPTYPHLSSHTPICPHIPHLSLYTPYVPTYPHPSLHTPICPYIPPYVCLRFKEGCHHFLSKSICRLKWIPNVIIV